MIFFFTQLFMSFISIFLRGLQTQNIVEGNYKMAVLTSVGMTIAQVAFIGLIAADPWASLIPTAIGGSLGVSYSMYVKGK